MVDRRQTPDKKDNPLTELAGQKHLPGWAKTMMAIVLMPVITVALLLFLYAKFAGLEDEFAMIAEAYSYSITGGPVNKQATEMGAMLDIMKDQLVAIEGMRSSNVTLKEQLMATMNRVEGRMDGLENQIDNLTYSLESMDDRIDRIGSRILMIEGWAEDHSADPKAAFEK